MAAALRRTLRLPLLRRHLTTAATTDAKPSSSSSLSNPVFAAKSAIRSESDPERIVSLFESVAHHPTFYGDRTIYRFAIRKLARRRRPELIERLLEGAKSSPDTPKTEGFLLRLICLYSDAGMIDHAVRTFEAMSDLGCRRTERALCGLLSAFLKNGQIDRLQDTFARAAEDYGVVPGVASYSVLLKALCAANKVEEARALLDEMPNKGVEPDIICYNAVLDGCFKNGDYAGFDDVLKEINRKKLNPDVATYNCRIAALCADGKSTQAAELLDVMKSKKVYPNTFTLNSLIHGFRKEGYMDSAMEVFERMKAVKRPDGSGVSPDSDTYITLLQGLVDKGEFEKAAEICKEGLENKWRLPFLAVKPLVMGLKENSQIDEAKDVVARMRKLMRGGSIGAWKKVAGAFAL